MFKSLLLLFVSLFFMACTPQTQMQPQANEGMPKMFQSVSPEKAHLVQSGENAHFCTRCGMDLVKFYKTSHAAAIGDKQYQYCSIHCLCEHLDEPNELKNPQVVDVSSLELIPVLEAYYVVGSSVRGTMSMVSKYAFKNLTDAQAFQKKHGGKIVDFYAALEIAREDFK